MLLASYVVLAIGLRISQHCAVSLQHLRSKCESGRPYPKSKVPCAQSGHMLAQWYRTWTKLGRNGLLEVPALAPAHSRRNATSGTVRREGWILVFRLPHKGNRSSTRNVMSELGPGTSEVAGPPNHTNAVGFGSCENLLFF